MKKNWFIIFLSLILCSCMDRVDNRNLRIYNNSDETIYFFVSKNDLFINPYKDYSTDRLNTNYCVKQDTFSYFVDRPVYWEEYIKDCKDEKIRLFVVAKDSVDKYGLQMVMSKCIFTKKFLLDIDSLNKSNWSVLYLVK